MAIGLLESSIGSSRYRPGAPTSAQSVLRRALDAFSQADPRAAHVVLGSDDEIDNAQDEVILQELEQIASHPDMASPAVDIIFIAKNLERVGDHATNIAEMVYYAATGEHMADRPGKSAK